MVNLANQLKQENIALSKSLEELRKPRQLECKANTVTSVRGKFPVARASIPANDKQAGFQLTGGGCQQVFPDENYALMQSRPDGDDGWVCQNGDLPGTPGNVQIQAYVVYCRLPKL
jgi:hypothetical protein